MSEAEKYLYPALIIALGFAAARLALLLVAPTLA